MTYIVTRCTPNRGRSETPLAAMFSAHNCTFGEHLGLKETYQTRAEAEADAQRLRDYAAANARDTDYSLVYLYQASPLAA